MTNNINIKFIVINILLTIFKLKLKQSYHIMINMNSMLYLQSYYIFFTSNDVEPLFKILIFIIVVKIYLFLNNIRSFLLNSTINLLNLSNNSKFNWLLSVVQTGIWNS